MKTMYRLTAEVVDKARERHGCTSDYELATVLKMSPHTVWRARHGEGINFSTGMILLDAAGISIPLGVIKAA